MTRELPDWRSWSPEDAQPFGRVKLIVADLDGTLVRQGASKVWSTIAKLRKSLAHPRYDVAFTIATGRTLAGVTALVASVGVQAGMPIVLYNGSVVTNVNGSKLLEQKFIPGCIVRKVVSDLMECDVTVMMYYFSRSAGTLLSSSGNVDTVYGYTVSEASEFEFNGLKVNWCSDLTGVPKCDASAILVHSENSEALSIADQRISSYSELSVTSSGGKCIEIRPNGSSKAQGLIAVVKALGISREEVLAIGDNDNDADMLQWAGIGVCVGDASKLAVNSSDYHCRYEVEQGALEVLRVVRWARRYFYMPRHST